LPSTLFSAILNRLNKNKRMADEANTTPQGTQQAMPTPAVKPVVAADKAPAPSPAMPGVPATPVAPVKPAVVKPAGPAATVKPMAKPGIAAPEATSDESKNVFTELFGEDKSQKGAGLMNTVVKQEDKKTKSLLTGEKPKLKSLKEKGKSSLRVSRATPGKLMLQVGVALLVLTAGFFFTQNSEGFSWFGTNVANRALIAEEQVEVYEAEIIVQKNLSAVMLLEQYSNLAGDYFYNLEQSESTYNSSNKRTTFKNTAAEQRPDLALLLAKVQVTLDGADSDDLIDAKTVVDDLITELKAQSGSVDEQDLLQDVQDLETTKKLLGSKSFKSSLAAIDTEAATDDDLQSVVNGYNGINTSVSALISSIKDGRVGWSFYMEEVEDLVKQVDPLFNTEFTGNITLDSVSFSDDGTVNISGQSVTDDSKNFTLISNLIDTLDASEHFEDVEERSYSKSASSSSVEDDDESYTGSFRITMQVIF